MKMSLLFLSFKNMKKKYFIPIIALWLIIPIISCIYIMAFGVEESAALTMDIWQMLIPITSTWWLFCMLKEYIEGVGNELLYLYENHSKTKTVDVFMLFFWYCLHVLVLYIAFSMIYNNIFYHFLQKNLTN